MIRRLVPADALACEAILRSLPDWFGMEESIVGYVAALPTLEGFTARLAGEVIGFLALRRHFPTAAEIHVMAVRAEHHRHGVGRRLVAAAEAALAADGVRFLAVKTLGPSREDAGYAATRSFYETVGFVPLEEFPALWSEENPCLQMVKVVTPAP